jgi:hypothetical protein
MTTYFVDSSALIKRYRQEGGSRQVSELLESADKLLIARLAIVEVSSALVRRARATNLSVEQLAAILATFDDELRRSFDVVELDAPVMAHAVVLARKHGLRGADAIQLTCALMARNEARDPKFALVSCDEELNAASAAEGLQVENPNRHL